MDKFICTKKRNQTKRNDKEELRRYVTNYKFTTWLEHKGPFTGTSVYIIGKYITT